MKKLFTVFLSVLVIQFAMGQKCVLKATVVKVNASCYGVRDGSIEVTPINGVGPYEYRLGTVGVYGTNNTFTNLRPGLYTVFLKDAGACTGTTSQISIDPASTLNVNIAKTDPLCNGAANGSISLTPVGGTAPYRYRLGTTGSYSLSNTFTGLKAGIILAYVKDLKGCIASARVTLTNPGLLTFDLSETNATCFNSSTGSLTATPTSGTAPYKYKLEATGTYGTSNMFLNLKAGSYTIFVQDATGCENSQMITVGQISKLGSSISVDHATCNGLGNGTIMVNGFGGTSPYLYKTDKTPAYGSSNSFSSLAGDDYRVYVKDANGCIQSTKVTVDQPSALIVAHTKTNVTCLGGTDGSITASGTGGTAPYEYKLSILPNFTTSGNFTGLKAGLYKVYIRDANGCTGNVLNITLTEANTPCFTSGNKGVVENKVAASTSSFDVTLVPNPSNNQFSIVTNASKAGPVSLRAMDINGKVVFQTRATTEQTIRFGGQLAPGLYMVEVRQGNEVKTVKALKVR